MRPVISPGGTATWTPATGKCRLVVPVRECEEWRMIIPSVRFALIALLALAPVVPAAAEQTAITVRVIARDAKFIGTSMGSARVVLRDVATGKTLAQGVTTGGTGDTQRIMHATGRNPNRAGEGDAAFAATIDIATPTLVELEAEGPLGFPGSVLRVTQRRWIMPGQPVTQGEGWTIELPGLVISPKTSLAGRTASISAKVELMCGCPITPGGLWDAADYKFDASLWRDGRQVAAAPLAFVAAPGGYAGDIGLPAKGRYKLVLHALNLRTGNSGLSETVIEGD
jgi:hypothetical protein